MGDALLVELCLLLLIRGRSFWVLGRIVIVVVKVIGSDLYQIIGCAFAVPRLVAHSHFSECILHGFFELKCHFMGCEIILLLLTLLDHGIVFLSFLSFALG